MRLIQHLFRQQQYFPNSEILHRAAARGATNIVGFLLSLHNIQDPHILEQAALFGSLTHFERVRCMGPFVVTPRAVGNAIRSNRFELILHLFTNLAPTDTETLEHAALAAAEFASVETIRFLLGRRVPFEASCLTIAALRGRVRVLRLLLISGVLPDREAVTPALLQGRVDVVEVFLQHSNIYNEAFCAAALVGGHRPIVKLFVEHGIRFSSELRGRFPGFFE